MIRMALALAALMAMSGQALAQGKGIERLMCTFGPYERQVRFAMELVKGQPSYIAFWNSSGAFRCSFDAKRDDAMSRWADYGNHTLITLLRGKGSALIEKEHSGYLVRVQELDRMPFCGTTGEITGILTLTRQKGGKAECHWQGPYAKDDD
jgi:hypothetical protein